MICLTGGDLSTGPGIIKKDELIFYLSLTFPLHILVERETEILQKSVGLSFIAPRPDPSDQV